MKSILESALLSFYWAVLCALFIGIGRAFTKRNAIGGDDLIEAFARGIIISAASIMVWRFFYAVTVVVPATLAIVGIFGCASVFRKMQPSRVESTSDSAHRKRLTQVLFVMVACLLLWRAANDAATYVPQVDGYHFTSIRWAHAYPYVPGLANVESRLGFNSSAIGLHAALSAFLGERGLSVLNGGVFFMMLATCLYLFICGRTRLDEIVAILLVFALVLPTLLFRDFYALGGVSPDTLVYLLICGLTAHIAHVLIRSQQEDTGVPPATKLLWLAMLVFLVTVKMSIVFYAIPMIVLSSSSILKGLPKIGWVNTTAALAPMGIWMGSNVLTSGWLAFPVPATRLELAWSVPLETGSWLRATILDWGRLEFGGSAGGSDAWILNWLRSLISSHLLDFTFPAVLVTLLIAIASVSRAGRNAWVFAMGSSMLLAAVGWLMNAPAPRFLIGPMISTIVGVGIFVSHAHYTVLVRKILFAGVAGFFLCTVLQRVQTESARVGSTYDAYISAARGLIVREPPGASGRYAIPLPESVEDVSSKIGITLVSGYAWRASLLSTTIRDPHVADTAFNEEGKFSAGFHSELTIFDHMRGRPRDIP